jgi:hypothetical protein
MTRDIVSKIFIASECDLMDIELRPAALFDLTQWISVLVLVR